MRLFHSKSVLPPAADDDLGSGGDHGASSRGLFPHCAVAGDLDFKPGGGGLLNDLAHRQTDERRNTKFLCVGNSDRCSQRRLFGGGLACGGGGLGGGGGNGWLLGGAGGGLG